MEERSTPTKSTAAGGSLRILAPLGVIGLIAAGLVAYYVYRYANPPVPPTKRDLAREARDDLESRNFRPLSAPLAALLADAKYEPIPTQAHALLLQPAPDFTLPDVPVLTDPSNKVAEKYETYVRSVKADQEGDLLHGTFVISRQGKIVWTNRGDSPFTENRTLLYEAARAEGRLPQAPP
jgi:hypothetical protein